VSAGCSIPAEAAVDPRALLELDEFLKVVGLLAIVQPRGPPGEPAALDERFSRAARLQAGVRRQLLRKVLIEREVSAPRLSADAVADPRVPV